ncbi:MAG: hypothetical protein JXQ72_01085 [Anaerolineae bacterium]|nr:hypothetical protein [Anaerolineae bacterium]
MKTRGGRDLNDLPFVQALNKQSWIPAVLALLAGRSMMGRGMVGRGISGRGCGRFICITPIPFLFAAFLCCGLFGMMQVGRGGGGFTLPVITLCCMGLCGVPVVLAVIAVVLLYQNVLDDDDDEKKKGKPKNTIEGSFVGDYADDTTDDEAGDNGEIGSITDLLP